MLCPIAIIKHAAIHVYELLKRLQHYDACQFFQIHHAFVEILQVQMGLFRIKVLLYQICNWIEDT